MINALQIAGLILGILTAIGGPIMLLVRAANRLLKRLEKNCFEIDVLKDDVKDSKLERKVMLRGILACLKGLEKLGCNGPVTLAKEEIEDYIITRSHE